MMLGAVVDGSRDAADPPSMGDSGDGSEGATAFPDDAPLGCNSISADQLVDLLRGRFFNVLLVDATAEPSGQAPARSAMDAPAPGTVSAQQPQAPDSWLASSMDRFHDYPPIVGSRRFASIARTREAVRLVPMRKLVETERRRSSDADAQMPMERGVPDSEVVVPSEGDGSESAASTPSRTKKKRDSGVDLKEETESGDEETYENDDEDLEGVHIRPTPADLDEDLSSPRRQTSRGSPMQCVDPSEWIVHPEDLEELDRAVYQASSNISDPHWQRRLHGLTVVIDEFGAEGGFAHRLSESLAREIADEFDPSAGSLIGRDDRPGEEVTCPRCSERRQFATECIYATEEDCRKAPRDEASETASESGDMSLPPPPPSAFRSAASFSIAQFTAGHPLTLYLSGGLRNFRKLYPQLCLDYPCPRMDAIRNHQDQLVDAVWYGRMPGGHSNDHPVEIVPHLYLGSAHAALPEHVGGYSIGMVIRLGAFSAGSKVDGIDYIDLEIDDAVGVHIGGLFDSVCEIIANRVSRGINVLVHCHAGVSRSATIVLAYLLMQSSGRYGIGPVCECHPESDHAIFRSLRSAFYYVFVRRPIVRPNEGFCKQLQSLEMALFGTGETTMPRWWMFASYLYGTDWIEFQLRIEEAMEAERRMLDGYESGSDGTSVDYHIYDSHAEMDGLITLRKLEDAIMTDIDEVR
ncbi:hypothetical protein DFJ74DRAFT_359913 [Hyaloraphidium curvatum]|nr:hypothetical protein DFJ74DRAFT_359913 [Hyaloraphidium curvatum]